MRATANNPTPFNHSSSSSLQIYLWPENICLLISFQHILAMSVDISYSGLEDEHIKDGLELGVDLIGVNMTGQV